MKNVPLNAFLATITRAFSFGFLVKIASWCKVSFVLGSTHTFFSLTGAVTPLSGAFGARVSVRIAVLSMVTLMRFLCGSWQCGLKHLAFIIPGWCAGLYWAIEHPLIRSVISLACIALFILHPVGGQAFVYSFYWVIPVVCAFSTRPMITALGSTFTAHAVGSVIWLYTVPTTAALWLSLIPLVAVERVLNAAGMTVVHAAITTIESLCANRQTRTPSSADVVNVGS